MPSLLGGSTGKLRMKFFYVFVPIMFSICSHMFPIMFSKFSILLIEEKVMSYVTVSKGHGHPLVIIIVITFNYFNVFIIFIV
jgi:hypothetical protein